MANEEARKAIDEFVDSVGAQNEASKDFLTKEETSFSKVASTVGGDFGETAFTEYPIYSGLTDPDEIAIVTESLSEIGTDVVQKAIVEDTANRLNRIFESTRAASFHLFEAGPDFFFDMISRQSRKLSAAVANAQLAAFEFLAAAAVYNTLHQTMDRSDLDNFDAAAAETARAGVIAALSRIQLALKQADSGGAIPESTTEQAIEELEALCSFFATPKTVVAHLSMQQMVRRIADFDRALNQVIVVKGEFEEAVN